MTTRAMREIVCATCGRTKLVRADGPTRFCDRRCAARPLEERFWGAVDFDGPVVAGLLDRCWLWKGAPDRDGYGHFRPGGREANPAPAHRVAFALWHGEWAPDAVDHLCLARLCVNPYHLDAVTARENVRRSNGVASRLAAQTHCKRGHLLEGRNLRMKGRSRACRACTNDAARTYYANRKAALA